MNMIYDNLQKILGTGSAVVAAIISYAATGGLNQVIDARGLQILGLVNVVLGAATVASGVNNTAKMKVAQAMETAIQATPPPRQAGFARVGLLGMLSIIGLCVLSACATTGGNQMDASGKLALETSVRIAVRHAVEGSPRALEKAAHIRSIVATVQSVTSAESTVAALEGVVRAEVGKLNLSPLDKADAEDLITLLGVALEARFQGTDAAKLVAVNEFLSLVLSALPPPAAG